jgi:ribosomal protein L11 methyltransferase
VRVAESDGYGSAVVQSETPYDLIAANILARPLIAMAPDAAAALTAGGHAILSGILAEQAQMVLEAHESAGFAHTGRLDFDKWTTLVLTKI